MSPPAMVYLRAVLCQDKQRLKHECGMLAYLAHLYARMSSGAIEPHVISAGCLSGLQQPPQRDGSVGFRVSCGICDLLLRQSDFLIPLR
eukprot:4054841-Amphidinium_carterae.2